MGILLLLAEAAGAELSEAAGEHGFGFNFNILEANLVNLAIVIGVVVYFGGSFLGKALAERKSEIGTAIQEAEQRKKNAAAALADQQQKLAQAQAKAVRIRAAAEESAKTARDAVLTQAEQDIERLKAAAAQDLTSQQEKVINELRQRVVALALQNVEARLQSGLSSDAQHQLIDRSIALLEGGS